MILHRLVDIKISAGRGVKTGEQLVDHDQQLHVGRLAGEQRLGLFLVSLGLVHVGPGLDIFQQILVGVIDELPVSLGVGAGFLPGHIPGLGIVGGDHRAFALEGGLLEQLVILAGLIDAGSDQNGVAPLARQPRLATEIEDDVAHHPVHPRFGAEHLLQGAPMIFQLGLLPVVQSPGLGLKPGVDLLRRAEPLVDIPRLVDQVQYHPVCHALTEFVGVNVAAEDFPAGSAVLRQQRGAGEADEHRAGQQRLHHPVQLAALDAVTLVDEQEQLPHRRGGLGFQFFDEFLKVVGFPPPELVD